MLVKIASVLLLACTVHGFPSFDGYRLDGLHPYLNMSETTTATFNKQLIFNMTIDVSLFTENSQPDIGEGIAEQMLLKIADIVEEYPQDTSMASFEATEKGLPLLYKVGVLEKITVTSGKSKKQGALLLILKIWARRKHHYEMAISTLKNMKTM